MQIAASTAFHVSGLICCGGRAFFMTYFSVLAAKMECNVHHRMRYNNRFSRRRGSCHGSLRALGSVSRFPNCAKIFSRAAASFGSMRWHVRHFSPDHRFLTHGKLPLLGSPRALRRPCLLRLFSPG